MGWRVSDRFVDWLRVIPKEICLCDYNFLQVKTKLNFVMREDWGEFFGSMSIEDLRNTINHGGEAGNTCCLIPMVQAIRKLIRR